MFESYNTWVLSICASCLIGLSGVVPLALIPMVDTDDLKGDRTEKRGKSLRLLLSFSVGGLLGDIFLHLLPEAWQHLSKGNTDPHAGHLFLGLWVLAGILTFIIIEMIFAAKEEKDNEDQKDKTIENTNYQNNYNHLNGNKSLYPVKEPNHVYQNGGHSNEKEKVNGDVKKDCCCQKVHITGYLNLLANSIDNFTHGLAVAASFLVGTKMGLLTTLAILIHEIPHELGDFAILLKSGFSRLEAAKAQMSTALIGILGAVVALSADSAESIGDKTLWILPFTAGGFLNVALVSVLPEIIEESDPWESLKQVLCVIIGIAVMAFVSCIPL